MSIPFEEADGAIEATCADSCVFGFWSDGFSPAIVFRDKKTGLRVSFCVAGQLPSAVGHSGSIGPISGTEIAKGTMTRSNPADGATGTYANRRTLACYNHRLAGRCRAIGP